MNHHPATARALGLVAHPEGGWYRRVYTSPYELSHPERQGVRPTASLIHYLLRPGEQSRWHKVASDEIWLLHRGGLNLYISPPGLHPTIEQHHRLGTDPANGDCLQILVPAGHWQRAVPIGDSEALVSCLVTPGFDFEDFTLHSE
ncbi:cupin domain-containing protein [Streptomyces sp. NPDC005500]|uniref:cupin domain-containing protein n=1 Tax=Streptomyces sp. NPDC005500 TaxID=3155007 RepID=UPI0033BA9252